MAVAARSTAGERREVRERQGYEEEGGGAVLRLGSMETTVAAATMVVRLRLRRPWVEKAREIAQTPHLCIASHLDAMLERRTKRGADEIRSPPAAPQTRPAPRSLLQRRAGKQKFHHSGFSSRSAAASRRDLGPLPRSSAAT